MKLFSTARFRKCVTGLFGFSFLLLSPVIYATDWWTISDDDFATKFEPMAFSSDITQQATVAWMLFARLNQPMPYQNKTVSTWELWPSNQDTFSPAAPPFAAQNKIRPRPHLELTKFAQATGQFHTFPDRAGEERTRNMLSYDYIRGNGLITKAGVSSYVGSNAIDLPIGSVETKADWTQGALPGAYQFTDNTTGTVYSLNGLHIMAKMRPTPADPFSSNDPSWFWTTFELNSNAGLANVRTMITYKDVLGTKNGGALLDEAGLSGSPFLNYSPNGTQIRFADSINPNIVLGNSKMESFAGLPDPNQPPQNWTGFNSSCHTCHATAAFNPSTNTYFGFRADIGTGDLPASLMNGYKSVDFVWSISFNAQ